MVAFVATVLATGALGAGCSDDPRYIAPAESIEIGIPGSDIREASTQILLPIVWNAKKKPPSAASERQSLATWFRSS